MSDFGEKRKIFQDELSKGVDTNSDSPNEQYKFNPNVVAKEIEKEQLMEFVGMIKGTPNENLIAFKDPKVLELIDFALAALPVEISRLNNNTYPIQTYTRFKSNHSMKTKQEDWDTREERKGAKITDYFAIRIIPSKEPSLWTARGEDPELQRKIDRREMIRKYIEARNKKLYEKPTLTFEEYCKTCRGVITVLSHLFPKDAKIRKQYYKDLIDTVYEDYESYSQRVEDPNIPMPLDKITKYTKVNISKVLKELEKTNPTQVILHKLTNDLLNTFDNSELLQGLRYIDSWL